MELNRIIQHNVLEPWPLPDKAVHCIVTSPPYWGLRDYKVDGQLGLEKTPEEFIANMVKVFQQGWRVLRDDGTLWLNMGDSYCHAGGQYDRSKSTLKGTQPGPDEIGMAKRFRKGGGNLKTKDLVGIPWMLAFALRADGWYLRQDIIWHKPNPMPESTQDRCTKSHEYLFMFSKKPQYYYDAFAIRTPYADKTFTTFGIPSTGHGDGTGMIQSENWARDIPVRQPKKWKTPDGWDTGKGSHGSFFKNGREKGKKPVTVAELETMGANKRSVWTVATAGFKEAHFATFPEELIKDPIKAGCPGGGIVLDPFMGSGTTAVVAQKQGRNFLGFEINPDYIAMAERRLQKELGLFYPLSSKL